MKAFDILQIIVLAVAISSNERDETELWNKCGNTPDICLCGYGTQDNFLLLHLWILEILLSPAIQMH